MKLTLNGPQAITIFTVAKDELVPSSARASSFATPQAYYCTESGKLKMFIKGHEYCFLDHEVHVEELAAVNAELAKAHENLVKAQDEVTSLRDASKGSTHSEPAGHSGKLESLTGRPRDSAASYANQDIDEMWKRWNEIYAKHEELESRLGKVETELADVHTNIYTPLHNAFHAMLGVGK